MNRLQILLLPAVLAVVLFCAGCASSGSAPAPLANNFRAHANFTSHMVLQWGKPVAISGVCDPGSAVIVSIDGQTCRAVGDANGQWRAVFPAQPFGQTPHRVTVSGAEGRPAIVFDDVLFGDVWLCSGQSNMAMPVNGGRFWRCRNAEEEVRNAGNPCIRLFQSRNIVSPGRVQDEIQGSGWMPCTPENVSGFSAAAYFFGRQYFRDTGIPVGLINSSWGGTRIEAWISEEGYRRGARENELFGIELCRMTPEAQKEAVADRAGRIQHLNRQWYDAFHEQGAAECRAAESWRRTDYDDSGWECAVPPPPFPEAADGVGYYRLHIDMPQEYAGKDLLLKIDAIDDCDITFFNGSEIGRTDRSVPNYWAARREYAVPGKLVKPGDNVLAIEVTDYAMGGGIAGRTALTVKENGAAVALGAKWKFKMAYAADEGKLGARPEVPAVYDDVKSPSFPATLYNSMIAPWTRCAVRGILWYQGCSNAGSADYYDLHRLLIMDWRRKWNDAMLPFVLVQLAGVEKHTPQKRLADDYWKTQEPKEFAAYALTREIQAEMLNLPNVGMAVAMDIGDHSDIHPADKQTLGFRLAKEAERIVGNKAVAGKVTQGPRYAGMQIEGDRIRLFFDNLGGGLTTSDGKAPGAFAIGGKDGKLHWAEAHIEGDTVVVTSPRVKAPVRVRYAWVQYRGDVNLCNRDGFAAVPFRTDKPEYKPAMPADWALE